MLLIFDCDGVLIDSMPLHNRAEVEALACCGINVSPQEMAIRFSGCSLEMVLGTLAVETGKEIPPRVAIEMDNTKVALFTKELQPISGVFSMLDALGDRPRCVASGTDVPLLTLSLQITKLYDLFAPSIFSAEMVPRGKPAPDLFLHAMKTMKVGDPAECLVIEDGVAGVKAAKAANMRVFGFTGGSHCDAKHGERLIAAGAELVFADMRELVGLVERL